MSFFLLWILATIDSGFIGYRVAAGRNALIAKRDYYRRAMIRGAVLGQIAAAIAGVVAVLILMLSRQPVAVFDDFERVAERMLMVYVPYAAVILVTFCIRAIPSVDIRSIASVLVFGPFTLLRPLVVCAGAIWATLAAPSISVLLLIVLIVFLMLSMEYILDRFAILLKNES